VCRLRNRRVQNDGRRTVRNPAPPDELKLALRTCSEGGPSEGPVRQPGVRDPAWVHREEVAVFAGRRGQSDGGEAEKQTEGDDERRPEEMSLTSAGAGRRCKTFIVQVGLDQSRRCKLGTQLDSEPKNLRWKGLLAPALMRARRKMLPARPGSDKSRRGNRGSGQPRAGLCSSPPPRATVRA
jgi:hypothetical protein